MKTFIKTFTLLFCSIAGALTVFIGGGAFVVELYKQLDWFWASIITLAIICAITAGFETYKDKK